MPGPVLTRAAAQLLSLAGDGTWPHTGDPSRGPEASRRGPGQLLSLAGDGTWPRCDPEDRDLVVDG
jgi:hypothetical protein